MGALRRKTLRVGAVSMVAGILAALTIPSAAAAYTTSAAFAATDFVTGLPNFGPNNVGPVGLAFDATNHLWVMDYYNGILYRFDGTGGPADAIHQVTVGPSPWQRGDATGITFSKSGRLYVALQASSQVAEVSLTNGQVLRTVASAHCATGIATDPVSGDLLVSDPCPGNSTRIHNPDSASPSVSIDSWPNWADGITFAPDGSIWSTYYGQYLVHVVGGAPERYVYVPGGPDGTAVSAGADGAVFANTNQGQVIRYDPATNSTSVIYSGGSRGDFSTVGPDGCLYITQTDSIVRISDARGGCPFAPTTALPVLQVTPASQTLHARETADLTAKLTNVSNPAGTVVTFAVNGPNARTLTAVADATGVATVSYTGTSTGTDSVVAKTTVGALNVESSPALVTWLRSVEMPPAMTATSFSGTEGSEFSGQVALFTDPDTAATASEYTATVTWGDASSSVGTVTQAGPGQFTVSGTHTYAEEAVYTASVTITDTDDAANTQTVSPTATIGDAALTAGTLTVSSAVEGAEPTSVKLAFSDANAGSMATDFTATINWGDGTSTTAPVAGSAGSFTAAGSHAYGEEGLYQVTVTVSDAGGSTANASAAVGVNDAAITATGNAAFVSTNPVNGTVASFTDANPAATTVDFTTGGGAVTIDWGDSHTSSGNVTQAGPGRFTVSGRHTYAALGPYTITVNVVDDGGSAATAKTNVIVYAPSGGGNFVIGDRNATADTPVQFWGAQWAKSNPLSSGSAPSAFKGFADAPAAAACGTNWTAALGNGTPPPPANVPSYMAVIVSSSIAKTGSTIGGNTSHLVVVRTDAGYAPSPDHPGTGVVVAVIC